MGLLRQPLPFPPVYFQAHNFRFGLLSEIPTYSLISFTLQRRQDFAAFWVYPIACGDLMIKETPDGAIVSEGGQLVVQNFETYGVKHGLDIQGTAGGTVTWSLAAANFDDRHQFDYTLSLDGFDPFALLQQAFNEWASVANIKFVYVADSAATDIRFGMDDVDGDSGIIATTYSWIAGDVFAYSDIAFDTGETWSPYTGGWQVSFYNVALHEIGHAIGMAHENDIPVVMNSIIEGFGYVINSLTPDDIAGIRSIYGASVQGTNVSGTGYNDNMHGTEQAQTMNGLAGDDLVRGYGGDDVIRGNAGYDLIYGNVGDDLIYGNQQTDIVFGGRDQDTIYGGQGADLIYGNVMDDVVYGNLGDDLLYGGQDQDVLFGGQDNDHIFGNKGNDQLFGNRGDDWLAGGTGADQFVFGHYSDDDVIVDFDAANDLVLLISNVNGTDMDTGTDAVARLSQVGADVVLDLGLGHTVSFAGLDIGQLGEDNFVFF